MKLQIFESKDKNWVFRFKNKGRVINSGKGYNTRYNAERGANNFIQELIEAVENDKLNVEYISTEEAIG